MLAEFFDNQVHVFSSDNRISAALNLLEEILHSVVIIDDNLDCVFGSHVVVVALRKLWIENLPCVFELSFELVISFLRVFTGEKILKFQNSHGSIPPVDDITPRCQRPSLTGTLINDCHLPRNTFFCSVRSR